MEDQAHNESIETVKINESSMNNIPQQHRYFTQDSDANHCENAMIMSDEAIRKHESSQKTLKN